MVKYYVVHKCQETACNQGRDVQAQSLVGEISVPGVIESLQIWNTKKTSEFQQFCFFLRVTRVARVEVFYAPACNYKPDRKPCNPGIHIQNHKSENLWDTEIKYIAQGHSNCRSRAFTTEKKYAEFLETTCVKCSDLISTGVPRSDFTATNSTVLKQKFKLQSGEFKNIIQSCPESENEELDLVVKPCKKRARSPETEITSKKVKYNQISSK